MKKSILIYGCLAALACGALAYAFWPEKTPAATPAAAETPAPQKPRRKGLTKLPPAEKAKARPAAAKSAKSGKKGRRGLGLRPRPVVATNNDYEVPDEDWNRLSPRDRELYAKLYQAFDSDDRKRVAAAVRELQAMPDYPDGVSVTLREYVAENLGWYGSDALPQLLNALNDTNSEVRETATDSYVMAMQDGDLTEAQISAAIVAGAQVITDADQLDTLLNEIDSCNMRNSVAVSTMISVMETGTAEAQTVLQEVINNFTSTDEDTGLISTADGLNNWLQENPDGEDDNEFYAPISNGD